MRIIEDIDLTDNDSERKIKYNDYLRKHIGGVNKSFKEFIFPVLQEDETFSAEDIAKIQDQINNHDQSKYQEPEYTGYLDWFYPSEKSPKDKTKFNYAWNSHQHLNSHHWQHWICRSDDDEDTILDMDFASIIEMLCDWSSFQFLEEFGLGGTANEWYKENGKKMLLSDKTREVVEKYLSECEGL